MHMPVRSMTVRMRGPGILSTSDTVRTRMRVSLLTASVRMTYPGTHKSRRRHDENQHDPHDRRN